MKEITKNLMIILVRGGVEIPIDNENLPALQERIAKGTFVQIDNNLINTKDIVGVFKPEILDEMQRKRRGQWLDRNGIWRDKSDKECGNCKNIVPFGKKCGLCA